MEAGVTIAADTNRYRGVGLLYCASALGSVHESGGRRRRDDDGQLIIRSSGGRHFVPRGALCGGEEVIGRQPDVSLTSRQKEENSKLPRGDSTWHVA